jgi:hypothetical protein
VFAFLIIGDIPKRHLPSADRVIARLLGKMWIKAKAASTSSQAAVSPFNNCHYTSISFQSSLPSPPSNIRCIKKKVSFTVPLSDSSFDIMNLIKLTCLAFAVAFKFETAESKGCGMAPSWEHACLFEHYTDKQRQKVCESLVFFSSTDSCKSH